MRGDTLHIDPKKIKILGRNVMKMQKSTLPNFGISVSEKFGFAKNEKSASQNLKFDFDFEFWGCKIENLHPKIKNLHLKT